MSYHDDSHILTRLGILESTAECPNKEQASPRKKKRETFEEKERFVEVDIDGDATLSETDNDDDYMFDKDALLAATSNRTRVSGRRKTESFACRYLYLLLTFFSLGVVFHSSPDVLSSTGNDAHHTLYLLNSIGLLIGVFLGKFFITRVNWTFIILASLLLLTVMSWLLYTIQESVNFLFAALIQGVALGCVNYVGVSVWFLIWRGYNRKLVFFYTLLVAGAGVAILARGPIDVSTSTLAPQPWSGSLLVKRSADTSSLEDGGSIEDNSTSVRPKIKKPEVAQGIESVDSKTKTNVEERVKAEEARVNATLEEERARNETSTTSTTSTTISTTSPIVVTVSTTTVSSTTSTTTSTTTVPTTTSTTTTAPSVATEETVNQNSVSPPLLPSAVLRYSLDAVAERLAVIVLTVTMSCALIGLSCCCLSCRLSVDLKTKKLIDNSAPGLTKGCRLRLALFQLLCGAGDGILMMLVASESSDRMALACGSVFAFRLIALFVGPLFYSLALVWVMMLASLVSAVFLTLSPYSGICLFVAAGFIGLLPIMTTLYIETRLSPRPVVVVDNWLIPSALGHVFSLSLCHLMTSSALGTALVVCLSLMTVLFVFLSRSVAKAARLKEIMEYSSQPVPDGIGDYFSLIEREDEDFDGQLSDFEGLVDEERL